ncbi:MAG: type VI secretion system Vgr family protein [Deltaproteobacteria bacterium]|jgi:type VI secretion system VgrG family protein|nr:type VI secretion system Vgr family protein [Deltaproteobacteria bacterium]
MAAQNQTTYTLKLNAQPDLELTVLRFRGKAELNALYEIEVTALARTADLKGKEPRDFFAGEATFVMKDESREPARDAAPGAQAWKAAWHGVTTGFRKTGLAGEWTVMEFTLEPGLSVLRGQIQNRIHLDASSCDIVRDSLVFGGVAPDAFRFVFDRSAYPKRDFVFQHEEDLESFVMRTLEREGIGLSFDQTGDRDMAVFTDANSQFQPLVDGAGEIRVVASDVSGLGSGDSRPQIFGMRSVARVPKASVRLKDYNWQNPNRPLEVRLPVASWGRGEIYLYGENFDTEGEGRRLAGIRRDQELWAAEEFRAMSRIPGLMPGLTLEVTGAAQEGYDGRYLVCADEMEGSQSARVAVGLGLEIGGTAGEEAGETLHRLTLSRLSQPYRPARRTPVPKIAGQVTAWIDGEGSGDTPETDVYGRYKVLFPLDVSGRGNGKASGWIRMAQPYTGAGYGQNFPLTPGTEVLIAFVDGNPDRPVITGSVANAETGSVVNSSVPNAAGLGTKGGGSLMFRNDPEKQNVTLSAGSDRGHFTLASGSPTTAAVFADVASGTFTVNNVTSTFSSSNAAGYQYSINTSDDMMRQWTLLMASIRQAAEVAVEGAAQADIYNNGEVTRDNALMANNISAIVDYACAPFQSLGNLIVRRKSAPVPDPRLPDPNLVSIVGDDKGARTTWLSKTPFDTFSWASWLTGFLLLMKPVRDASTLARNVHSYDNPTPEEKAARDKLTESQKKAAHGLALTTDISKVLADLITLGVTMTTLRGLAGAVPAKGILINNKDSYVDVLSNSWAGVAAGGGPLLLESNDLRASDDMRCAGLEFDRTAILPSVLADEATEAVGNAAQAGAVLLHGKLVRTFCDDLSLRAKTRVVAKSPVISLVTGTDIYPAAGAISGLTALSSRRVGIDYQSGISKGVDILAQAAGSKVRIQTKNSNDPVNVVSGATVTATARELALTKDGAKLRNGNDNYLDLTTAKTELAASAQQKITMQQSGVVVDAGAGIQLALETAQAKLAHTRSVEITGATGKITLAADGATLDGATMTKIKAALVQIAP